MQERRVANVEMSDAQPVPDDNCLLTDEDKRVLHVVGRNVEWLYDPRRFPGWSTTTAVPRDLTLPLLSASPPYRCVSNLKEGK